MNNAAANFPVPAEDLSPNGWRAVTQIVLDGTFFCSQELFRRASAAGEPGAICNILATQSFTGGPGMAHTAAAKAGVGNLTKTLAVEWAPGRGEGERLGAGPLPPRGHARRAHRPCAPRGEDVDAGRLRPGGSVGCTSWAGRPPGCVRPTPGSSPGHTLVVDGANWLRRDFVMPEFVPVRDADRRCAPSPAVVRPTTRQWSWGPAGPGPRHRHLGWADGRPHGAGPGDGSLVSVPGTADGSSVSDASSDGRGAEVADRGPGMPTSASTVCACGASWGSPSVWWGRAPTWRCRECCSPCSSRRGCRARWPSPSP